MNFFEHQEKARRRTGVLVFFYILAVILIMLGIYLAIIGIINVAGKPDESSEIVLWNPLLFQIVVGVTALIIISGTVYKILQLKAGGAIVAMMLGGRRVAPNSQDPLERKLLNVVEEMAIASGTPVPEVFILDEEISINAFAAGFSQNDAVVAVTRGCLERLNRDELQGVIAHEFSHIFNGDMNLNIKLMGILHGIIVLSLVGYWMMRVGFRSSGSHSSKNKKGNVGMFMVLIGLITMVIGYIGVFFASLIKSAISRQREFLADASAVQFTRNPSGIGGALKKIAGLAAGSRIGSSNAEQASHMFFANGLRESFIGLFATHPPLLERIRRIEGAVPVVDVEAGISSEPVAAAGVFHPIASGTISQLSADAVITSIGNPQKEHLDYASKMISNIPVEILETARDVNGAQAIVFLLLMNTEDQNIYARQKEIIQNKSNNVIMGIFDKISHKIMQLERGYKIVIVDIAFGALKNMPLEGFNNFSEILKELSEVDMMIDLFEYTLQHIVKRRISKALGLVKKAQTKGIVSDYEKPLTAIISCLAYWGQPQTEAAREAFYKGMRYISPDKPVNILPRESCGLAGLDEALSSLDLAPPNVKQIAIKACVETIFADKQVTVEEAEMLRAIVEAMDCPAPPIFPGAKGDIAA